MSNAPRPAMCAIRSRSCAGQLRAFGHRMSASPSRSYASVVPQIGHSVGITNSRSSPVRRSTTGPTISGITSPALRSTTMSPISTPLRLTSSALCSVAFCTVEPETLIGSMIAYGVTRPVRPTLTAISRSRVVTSSGGYLNAIAQRGARDVEPSRRCSATWSILTTTPSISCSTECRCSP